MNRDPKRLYDGQVAWDGGQDGGNLPHLIQENQVVSLRNVTLRDGAPRNRPPYRYLGVNTSMMGDRFQGAMMYQGDGGDSDLLVMVDGHLWRIPTTFDSDPVDITPADADNSASYLFAWLFQAEKYAIVLQGVHRPIIYNGVTARRASPELNEIQAGYIGAYINGRIWLVMNDRRRYVAGDIVGGDSGTMPEQYRDAVLRFTENTYLAENGTFPTPANAGPINALSALTTLDTALGNGPVVIGCDHSMFSCNAPIDRTQWQELSYPIQSVCGMDYGPIAPRMMENVNADLWFRSRDGLRSFIIARRDFNAGWGNVPMSKEVDDILRYDTDFLLEFGSSVFFDNRYLATVSPYLNDQGVAHRGLVSLNFDNVTTMNRRTDPAYEGLWTGVEIFQLVKGIVRGQERCFAFVRGSQGGIQVWELLREGDADGDCGVINGTAFVTRIESQIVGRSHAFGNVNEPKQLDFAEIAHRDIRNTVDFDLDFRPDQSPEWVDWDAWTECTDLTACELECPPNINRQPGYKPRHMTPSAPSDCITNDTPANLGYGFQYRLNWTGHATPWRLRMQAIGLPQETIGGCVTACQDHDVCEEYWFDYQSKPEVGSL